mmetsp:Transcript_24956/g.71673  ORF Transcript_24956/g.71673 Transcript_24956/m.71673 type:complete len:264 (-) Transcript_24956:1110-1901(-)
MRSAACSCAAWEARALCFCALSNLAWSACRSSLRRSFMLRSRASRLRRSPSERSSSLERAPRSPSERSSCVIRARVSSSRQRVASEAAPKRSLSSRSRARSWTHSATASSLIFCACATCAFQSWSFADASSCKDCSRSAAWFCNNWTCARNDSTCFRSCSNWLSASLRRSSACCTFSSNFRMSESTVPRFSEASISAERISASSVLMRPSRSSARVSAASAREFSFRTWSSNSWHRVFKRSSWLCSLPFSLSALCGTKLITCS